MAANYDINYDDERFKQVETQKQEALNEVENTYNNMINQSDSFYQSQIDASKEWADKQQQLQNERTDFTIEQIEQQKDKANKDYLKEQSGAYTDWQKQSNRYGSNAEQMAAGGLLNTGFSESSQVSMYNTYQNRVATARESFNQAVLNYDNAIKDAQLQNNSALAEIAYNALQQQLELSLQGFQYKNSLISEQLSQKQAVDESYYNRWQDVLNQINTENSLAEQQRQYDENMKLQREQLAEEQRQYNESLQLQKAQLAEQQRQYNESLQLQKEQQYIKNLASNVASTVSRAASAVSGVTGQISKHSSTRQIETSYYKGDINSDVSKYGAFSNGYQPKGISGYGEVSKTGQTISLDTQTLSGDKKTVVQNVWKTSDGTLWYWDGRQNKYIKISTSSSHGGGVRSF